MSLYLGVDIGTSLSRAAVYKEGKPVILPIPPAEWRMDPFFDLSSLKHPFRGVDQDFMEAYKFAGVKQKIGFEETISYDNKEIRLLDVVSNIIGRMKTEAENSLKCGMEGAVVAVPSSFADKQRAAMISAAEGSGFGTVKLLDDSTAAVMGCRDIGDGSRFILVYSMGAGIFDVSIIENSGPRPRAVWHESDRFFGGHDFDGRIIRHIMENLGIAYADYSLTSIEVLRKIAEKLKIKLSDGFEAEVEIDPFHDLGLKTWTAERKKHVFRLRRGEFETSIAGMVESTIEKSQKALHEAGLTRENIDTVLLVGGSTKIPLIRRRLEEEFSSKMIKAPAEATAAGAAIYGGRLPAPERRSSEVSKNHAAPSANSAEKPDSEKKNRESPRHTWNAMFEKGFIEAETLWMADDKDAAIGRLEELHKNIAGYIAHLYWKRGNASFYDGRIDEALEYFSKGYEFNREDGDILSSLHKAYRKKADILLEQRLYSKAHRSVKLSLKYNPECPSCRELYNRIKAKIKTQQIPGAHSGGKHRKGKR